jgi:hypothetical protein
VKKFLSLLSCVFISLSMQGCLGTVLSATTDAALAVAKAPFQVAKAAAEVATEE